MLKLFRRVRQKLIVGSKLRQYILYAFGEILLVMVGILLALQVNNLNENRKKKYLIDSQLLNLSNSLKSDSMMWCRAIDVNEFRFSSFEYLLEKAGQSFDKLPALPKVDSTFIWQGPYPDTMDRSFISKSFSWFTRGFDNIIIDRTAMNEINNLGLYSEIEDDKLKTKIHDYYMHVDFHFSDENVKKRSDRDDEFHDYLRDKFIVRASDIPSFTDPIAFIEGDQGVILRLNEVRHTANWHSLQAIKAREMAHEIIQMIEREVGPRDQ